MENRYSAFLKNARSQSSTSEKEVESSPDYQALKQAYDQASQSRRYGLREINEKLRDLGAESWRVQNSFHGPSRLCRRFHLRHRDGHKRVLQAEQTERPRQI